MSTIIFTKLSEENLHADSLDGFVRHQEVKECWRKIGNEFILVPNEFVEDWNAEKCRENAQKMIDGIKENGFAYGAFCEDKLVGYIYVAKQFFGRTKQYIELQMFHISEPFRRMGLGKELFRLACGEAKMLGAKKLYISAHSSEESQAVYRSLGCMDAVEVNKDIAENEPYDVQMEYQLDLHPKGVGI